MVGGVGDFLNRKHQQHGGNENDAPAVRQDLSQRQAATQLKFAVSGTGLRGRSIPGSSLPSRAAVTGPARAGSPLAIQQPDTQNAFATQGKNQINGHGQAYAQTESHLWAESTLGSDSVDTVRDGSFADNDNALNVDYDHETRDRKSQGFAGFGESAGSSDERSESDAEEEEANQDNARYIRTYDNNLRQPGINNTNIPVRGGHTRRFGSEPQIQQHYNQNQVSGRLGYQFQDGRIQQQNIDTFAPSEIDEDTIHSTVSNGFHSNANGALENARQANRSSSKRQAEDISNLDFDHDKLYKMPYEALKKQPFDEDPNSTKPPLALPPAGSLKSLDERLEWYKSQPREVQAAFLATLPIEEWEQAGEWIMKQFGTVMTKVADARRERRKVATEFEARVAARDAKVKQEADSVATALQQLKHGGQDLLRGRTPT